MAKKRNKLFFTLISSFVIVSISASMFLFEKSFSILETSILTMLRHVYEQNVKPPDLGIESLVVRKVGSPTDDFNYYKYDATIVLKNSGGNLVNGQVVLRGYPDQKNVLVNNTEEGFTLWADESYIVRDYELILDGDYNGGEIKVEVDLVDGVDLYKDNNVYLLSLFEMPAKIGSITFEEILEDGAFSIDFDADLFGDRNYEFEVFVGEDVRYDKGDLRYAEVFTNENLYGYHRFRNSEENLRLAYEIFPTTETLAHAINFGTNPFEGKSEKFLFVKATNPKTGYYAVSNVLKFAPEEKMDRVQFAKMFVEDADIDIYDLGETHFEDVVEEEWYSSSLETLYNLGLLDLSRNSYDPGRTILRSEVLEIVLNFYDVNLAVETDGDHFEDVDSEHPIHPYVEAFAVSTGATLADHHFYPELPATDNYLKYLINEYSESN